MNQKADTENFSIDSTCVKVHQSANGGEKTENKAVGRTKGGLNTKIYAIVDGLGNPVVFLLSPGNDHDSTHAIEWMKKTDITGSNLPGDKACSTKEMIAVRIVLSVVNMFIQTVRNELFQRDSVLFRRYIVVGVLFYFLFPFN